MRNWVGSSEDWEVEKSLQMGEKLNERHGDLEDQPKAAESAWVWQVRSSKQEHVALCGSQFPVPYHPPRIINSLGIEEFGDRRR